MMRMRFGMRSVLTVLLAAVTAQAATYYVDVNYDGANGVPDGTATRPFTNLLAAAEVYVVGSGHTIRVARGEYKSTLEGGGEVFGQGGYSGGYDLQAKSGNWHGGYVGQVSGATFDWTGASRMLPSADALDPAAFTVINLTNANSRAFTSSGADHVLIFEGFVFRDSEVSQSSYHGGALRINGQLSASAVRHCVFINNRTTGEGGGLWLRARDGVSRNLIFLNNRAATGGGAHIYGDNGSHTLEDSVFSGNVATGHAGGLYVQSHTMNLNRVAFIGNQATLDGGGVGTWNNSGNGNNVTLVLRQCRFSNNTARSGAALGNNHYKGPLITLENCLVAGNTATDAGGYVILSRGVDSGGDITLRHTTVVDNTAAGGALYSDRSSGTLQGVLSVRNSVIAGNGTGIGMRGDPHSTPTINYNNVYNFATLYSGSASAGANDISVAPGFVDASSGDYRLAKTSPCLSAGMNIGVTTDLVGTARFTRFFPDMGCYEDPRFPGVLHLSPALRTDAAETLVEFLLANQAALPTHAFFVLDNTGDQGTADMGNWWKQSGDLGVQSQGRPFGHWFTGLAPAQTYHYRCVLSNDYDVVWGPPLSFTTPAAGTTLTWTGAAGDGLASTPGNWSGATVPTWSDAIVLDSTSNSNMTWNAGTGGLPPGVASWTQTADYTGTVTFNTTYPEFSTAFTLFTVTGDATVNGGIWTHQGHVSGQDTDASRRYWLRVAVTGNLTVGASGSIDVFGRGLVNKSPVDNQIVGTLGGQRSNNSQSGLPLPSRTTRGSITEPQALGRGGDWGMSNARFGGGAVWLTVGESSVIEGEILARAGTWSSPGNTPRSGSGGSIYLRTGTLSGSGLIDASNGDTASVGGGGRVAVVVTNSTSFGDVRMQAFGGGSGPAAAGTVYKAHSGHGAGQGILLLDNNNQTSSSYTQPYYAYGVTLMPDAANGGPVNLGQFADVIVTNRAILGINTDTVLDWNTVNLRVHNRDRSFIAIRSTNNVTWPATFTVDGFTLLLDVDPDVTGNWTVKADGRIAASYARHSSEGVTTGYPLVPPLTLTLNGNLTVEQNGEISVQRMGHHTLSGPGARSNNRAASHGGQGGSSDGIVVNPVYGSILFPATSGSGGSTSGNNFSPAGGRMRLTVTGTTTLDGELNAMPHTAHQERASGGSIWLTTGFLQGTTGNIIARGRDGDLGGGGGRIAVYLTAGNDIGGVTLDARGGVHASNPGAAGTVYVQRAAENPGGGTIAVWNEGRVQYNRAATPIPPATALVSDLPPVYGPFNDDLSRSSLALLQRGRVRLQADLELDNLSIASDAVLDLNGKTLHLKSATIDGTAVKAGAHSAVSLGVSQVIDSAGTDGLISIPPAGSLILIR